MFNILLSIALIIVLLDSGIVVGFFPFLLLFFFDGCFLEAGFLYAAQAGLELSIFLLQLPEC
jgi:general stress protein CsbA